MTPSENRDRMIDMLLKELAGGESPPDLRERVLRQLGPVRRPLVVRLPAYPRKAEAGIRRSPRWPRPAAAAAVVLAAGGAAAFLQYDRSLHLPSVRLLHGQAALDGAPLSAGPPEKARRGSVVVSGDGSAVELAYPDGSRIALEARTTLAVERGAFWRSAKRLDLREGSVRAAVQSQPEGRPLSFATPHAQAVVVGTRFDLTVTGVRTRLEVGGGVVRFVDLSTKRYVEVVAGHFAQCGPGEELTFGACAAAPLPPAVTGFTLMNADTDRPVPGFDPIPPDAVLSLSALPTRNLNLRANTRPEHVGSVRFLLEGPSEPTRQAAEQPTEDVWPYHLAGDEAAQGRPGNCKGWTPVPGRYRVGATPYAQAGGEGQTGETAEVSFEVRP